MWIWPRWKPGPRQPFDAVVHFAAVPSLMLQPENETYRVNVIGTYNVLEAAAKLGIQKVIIASSETTYGVCFSNGTVDPKVLPLEEDYEIDPMDSYGMSKKVNETTAAGFSAADGGGYLCAADWQCDRAARIPPKLPELFR